MRHGNPLQCSSLEKPTDRRAWWAAVSGVAQSRTRLKRLRSSSSSIPSVPPPLILAPQDLLCAGALSPLLLRGLTPTCLLCPLPLSSSALTQMSLLPKVQLAAPCWVDSESGNISQNSPHCVAGQDGPHENSCALAGRSDSKSANFSSRAPKGARSTTIPHAWIGKAQTAPSAAPGASCISCHPLES